MKERIISICLLLLAAVTVGLIVIGLPKKNYAQPASDFTEAVRNGNPTAAPASSSGDSSASTPAVAGEVIRLHILADSDSERDQAIKLALRDVLLPYLNAATLGAETKEEAMAQLTAQCAALTELANDALAQLQADYTATVSVERLYFPIRIYGSQTYLSEDAVIFPPGFYDSVQVVLGRGEGHNWWCLAYPSLCFIDSSYDYIPKDSDAYKMKIGTVKKSVLEKLFYGETLSELLAETPGVELSDADAADSTAGSDEITVYFGSRLWEIIKALLGKNVE